MDVIQPVKIIAVLVATAALVVAELVVLDVWDVLETVTILVAEHVERMTVKALAQPVVAQHVQKTASKDVILAVQRLVDLTVQVAQHNKGGFLWQN